MEIQLRGINAFIGGKHERHKKYGKDVFLLFFPYECLWKVEFLSIEMFMEGEFTFHSSVYGRRGFFP